VVPGSQVGGVEEEVEVPPVMTYIILNKMVVVVEVVLVMAVGRGEVYICITVILDME
jgi:hypothetical protein